MSQYVFLKQSDGSFLKLLADDNGVIQYTTNQADFTGIKAGDVTNAATADAPSDATAFTADLNIATASLKGLLPPQYYAAFDKQGTDLTDADATIQAITDKCSMYVLPAGTLTADHVLTLGHDNVGSTNHTMLLGIVVLDTSAHTYTIKDDAGTTLYTKEASRPATVFWFYLSPATGKFTANTFHWCN